MFADDRVSHVSVTHSSSDGVTGAFTTDGVNGPLLDHSNDESVSCSADTVNIESHTHFDAPSNEELAHDSLHESNFLQLEEGSDQSLVLECNSGSEETVLQNEYEKSPKTKRRRMSLQTACVSHIYHSTAHMGSDYEWMPYNIRQERPANRNRATWSTHSATDNDKSSAGRLKDSLHDTPTSIKRKSTHPVQCKLCRRFVGQQTAYKCLRCRAKHNSSNSSHNTQTSTADDVPTLSKHRRFEKCEFLMNSAAHLQCCRESKTHKSSSGATASSSDLYQFLLCSALLTADTNVDDVLHLSIDGDDDGLRSVLSEDRLIRQYASLHMQSFRDQNCESSDHIYQLCRDVRLLARLVIACRRLNLSADLYSLVHPDHFNQVIAMARSQPVAVADILGRVVSTKLVDTLQRNDNVAARQAWNFRELLLLWQENLAESDAVSQTDDNMQEETHGSTANRCETLSETFQQPKKMECNSDLQSESEDNATLAKESALYDTVEDSPLQNTIPVASLALYRDGCFDHADFGLSGNLSVLRSADETSSAVVEIAPKYEYVHGAEAYGVIETDYQLNAVTNNHQQPDALDTAQHVDSESSTSNINSSRAITIGRSSGEHSYCCYCGQPQSRIESHWKSQHPEVVALTSLSGAARIRSLEKLRNFGNHRHNQDVLQNGRGTLVVAYAPSWEAKPEDYSPCKFCWSYMTDAEISQHRCSFSPQESPRYASDNSLAATSSDGTHSRISGRKSSKLGEIRKVQGSIQVVSCGTCGSSNKPKTRCYFCGVWNSHVQRHWHCKHFNEPEVKELRSLGPSAKEPYVIRLRNLGIHQHNVSVLKEGRGQFFVSRISERSNVTDYLPCEYCWMYLSRSNYCRHHCKCRIMADSEESVSSSSPPSTADAPFLLPTAKLFCDQVTELLDGISDSNVKLVAKSDQLIGEFTAKLLSLGVARVSVTARVRLLARFLIEVRQQTGLGEATLVEFISPANFRQCINAVNALNRYDPETSSCRKLTPTVIMRNVLRQASKLLKREAVDRRDRDAVKEADKFAQLCLSEWKSVDSVPEEENNPNVETD